MSPAAGTAARAVPLRTSPAAPAAAPRRTGALRLVPQRRSSAGKAPFVVVVVTLLVGGLLGLLLLNTLVAQDSFVLHDLTKQGKALDQREQELAGQVQALQAPADLAARATALGMVPGGPPAFLRLPDGRVLGQPVAGAAPPAAPAPVAKPVAQPATKPVTKPVTKPATKAVTKPATKPTQPATRPTTLTGAHR